MIDALRFVQGAVATKDFVPELTHFRITAGHVMGFNGRIALCSPIDLDLDVAPKASTFAKALLSCGDRVSIHLTDAGKLAVRSDNFRVYVECLDAPMFTTFPIGDVYAPPANLVDHFKAVAPFMGQDASREWSMAAHIADGCVYATNNVVAVERWIGGDLPPITIPHSTVREVLRIGIDPISIQLDQHSLTFWYGEGKWLRTQLIQDEWPLAKFRTIFEHVQIDRCQEVDPLLFDALDKLKPFMPAMSNRILLLGDRIATHEDEGIGAAHDISGLPERAAFDRNMLALVGTVATHIDLASQPACFYADRLRGVIMGMTL